MSDTEYEVRFFTNRFVLNNSIKGDTVYYLIKKIPQDLHLKGVKREGIDTPFEFINSTSTLIIKTVIKSTGDYTFTIHYNDTKESTYKTSLKYELNVFARRFLSEFRDNVLSKNQTLKNLGQSVVRRLKMTSETHQSD